MKLTPSDYRMSHKKTLESTLSKREEKYLSGFLLFFLGHPARKLKDVAKEVLTQTVAGENSIV